MKRQSINPLVLVTLLAAFLPLQVQAAANQRIQHTVLADGHPLAVFEKRPAAPIRAAVLLVHGRTWSSVPDFDLEVPGEDLSLMDGLVERGFAAYAVDLRGYGQTPRDRSGWATPDRSAADVRSVLEFIKGRENETAFLFGWSNGSLVAQLTAQNHPESLTGLILFGYPIRPATRFEAEELPDEPPRHSNTRKAAASDFITPGSISQAAIEAYVDAALEADPIRVDWRAREQWRQLAPEKILVPVQLLQGEHDPLAPTEAQAAFFSRVASPNREWVVIAGGDHAAFLETPRERFVDSLADFMERFASHRFSPAPP